MEPVRRINEELAVAGALTFLQFEHLAHEGFSSILSLRLPHLDHPMDEQLYVEQLGLHYVSLAIAHNGISPESAVRVLRQMDELPKPLLVYCHNAAIAATMVLMHIALHQGETLAQAFKRAEKFGLFIEHDGVEESDAASLSR